MVVALEVVQSTDMKMVVVSWRVIGPIGLLPDVAIPTMASTISAAATRLVIIAVELTPLRVLTLLNTRWSIDNLIGSYWGLTGLVEDGDYRTTFTTFVNMKTGRTM